MGNGSTCHAYREEQPSLHAAVELLAQSAWALYTVDGGHLARRPRLTRADGGLLARLGNGPPYKDHRFLHTRGGAI